MYYRLHAYIPYRIYPTLQDIPYPTLHDIGLCIDTYIPIVIVQ